MKIEEVNNETLTEIFQTHKNDRKLQVIEVKHVDGDTTGFQSVLNRVAVKVMNGDGTEEVIKIVVKKPVPSAMEVQTWKVLKNMMREVMFYQRIIPSIIGDEEDESDAQFLRDLFPRLYYGYSSLAEGPGLRKNWCQRVCCCPCFLPTLGRDEGILIMEDVTGRPGVEIPDKAKRQDLATVKKYLKTLGRFHGIAWRWIHRQETGKVKQPTDMTAKDVRNIQENVHVPTQLYTMVKGGVYKVLKKVIELEGTEEDMAVLDKVKRYNDSHIAADMWREKLSHNSPSTKFDTLCLGDFWVANTMCVYNNDGTPDRITLIDFQHHGIDHPGQDIVEYVYSGTDPAFRKAHLDEVLRTYFEALQSYMEPFVQATFDEFMVGYRRVEEQMAFMYATFFPVFQLYPEPYPKDMSIREMMQFSDRRQQRITSAEETDPRVIEIRKRIFEGYREVKERGWLE